MMTRLSQLAEPVSESVLNRRHTRKGKFSVKQLSLTRENNWTVGLATENKLISAANYSLWEYQIKINLLLTIFDFKIVKESSIEWMYQSTTHTKRTFGPIADKRMKIIHVTSLKCWACLWRFLDAPMTFIANAKETTINRVKADTQLCLFLFWKKFSCFRVVSFRFGIDAHVISMVCGEQILLGR